MKTYRLKFFHDSDRIAYVEQKRWLFFFWLTPYLCGNFGTGFYTGYRLLGGNNYCWKESSPFGNGEHKEVMAYYD
jgi:hypothetical protein